MMAGKAQSSPLKGQAMTPPLPALPQQVLKTSRVMVSWMVVGAAMGVFDMTHRYLCERHQFGVPLAGMALNQEKLMRMLGGVQASLGMIMRLTRLREEGKMTPGMSSLVKGWVSKQCREVRAHISPLRQLRVLS